MTEVLSPYTTKGLDSVSGGLRPNKYWERRGYAPRRPSMSLSRFVLNSLLAIILPLMGSVVVFAQYTTATLSGTVSDTSGAVVGDAKISVQNIETGLHRE